jgi:PiT family inorganic phosphate transporter
LPDLNTLYLSLALIIGMCMAWGIGANDVSNAMGTSVGSKALTLKQALIIAGIFEFLGAYIAGGEVTATIRKGIINPSILSNSPDIFITGMLASSLASGIWLIVASHFGWPVSTTHTVVGSIIGFGLVVLGPEAIQWKQCTTIAIAWVCSPIMGGLLAYLIFVSTQFFIFDKTNPVKAAKVAVPGYACLAVMVVITIVCNKFLPKNFAYKYLVILGAAVLSLGFSRYYVQHMHFAAKKEEPSTASFANVEKIFAILMVLTACVMAFAHGSNDVANAIGPIAAIIDAIKFGEVQSHTHVPKWLLLLGGIGIITGLATYGHKVMATVGNNITALTPSRGFAATLAAAIIIVEASTTGLPISTTHTLIGAILGVGLAKGMHALNMSVIRKIFLCWIFELPAGAFLSATFFYCFRAIFLWYSC